MLYNLFGDDDQTFKHFTEYAMENSLVDASMADSDLVKIMNAMNYVDGKNSTPANNWRIRAGTKDLNSAQFTPRGISDKYGEGWK